MAAGLGSPAATQPLGRAADSELRGEEAPKWFDGEKENIALFCDALRTAKWQE